MKAGRTPTSSFVVDKTVGVASEEFRFDTPHLDAGSFITMIAQILMQCNQVSSHRFSGVSDLQYFFQTVIHFIPVNNIPEGVNKFCSFIFVVKIVGMFKNI